GHAMICSLRQRHICFSLMSTDLIIYRHIKPAALMTKCAEKHQLDLTHTPSLPLSHTHTHTQTHTNTNIHKYRALHTCTHILKNITSLSHTHPLSLSHTHTHTHTHTHKHTYTHTHT